jgi:hypothetical protein
MNFRLTAALFGTVLVVGLVLLGLALWSEDKTETGDLLLADIAAAKPEQITTVELQRGDAKLVLKRTGKDQWAITEPIAAKADAAAVNAVVTALLQARPIYYQELSTNPVVHGLDNPGLKVTLTDEGGKTGTLNIGDVSVGTGSAGSAKSVAFVTTPKRPRPMAVARSTVDPLLKDSTKAAAKAGDIAKWTSDYRTKQVFSVDPRTGADDVTAIKLTAKGKELALSKAGGGWKFDAPAGWGEASVAGETTAANPNAITGVRPLLNTVVNLQAATADDFIESPADLKEYGLNADNPDRIRVELKGKDGPAEVAFIGKKVDAGPAPPPAFPGAPPPPAKVYVQVEGSPGVVRVATGPNFDGLAAVIADPAPLRDRDLLKDDTRNRVDAIDVTVGKDTVKLRKAGGSAEWKLYGGPGDPQTAGADAVKKLLDLLGQPRVVKDFPAPNDAHFAPGEVKAEVKLWADGVKPNADPKADPKAEPKVEGAPTVLQFGKSDAAGVYVRRTLPNLTKTDFLLPAKVKIGTAADETDVLAVVARTRLAYLDPSLAKFSSFQANRLTTTHGQAVGVEVTFDKTPDVPSFPAGKWTFVKPDARKGQLADSGTIGDLLNLLATQSAGPFVHEQPTRDDLFRFGLLPENPKLKVEVGLDTGPPPAAGATPPPPADTRRVYYFGNDYDKDTSLVYARQEGRDAVFTVPKFISERFVNPDLRDKTVVRFDKAKVNKVEIQGWYETNRTKTTLKFERKGGYWTAADGFPVDPAKVDQFLTLLDGVRAKAFLPGPLKPEQKFAIAPEPNQPAQSPDQYKGLGVNIELEGGKKVELNLGDATDGGNSYYLWCGSLPPGEQVVTVQSDPFKPFKEKPAAFAK